MTPRTYELDEGPQGTRTFVCRFCGGETADAASVERLYCSHCQWFHERLDEDSVDFSRHLYTAVQEVRCALDLAEAAGDDVGKVESLKAALRQLRKALSRA